MTIANTARQLARVLLIASLPAMLSGKALAAETASETTAKAPHSDAPQPATAPRRLGRQRVPGGRNPGDLVFSGDGNRLVSIKAEKLYVVDANDGRPLRSVTFPAPSQRMNRHGFSGPRMADFTLTHDGRFFRYIQTASLMVIDIDLLTGDGETRGMEVADRAKLTTTYSGDAFTKDGNYVAHLAENNMLVLRRLSGEAVWVQRTKPKTRWKRLAVSPDGRFVACSGRTVTGPRSRAISMQVFDTHDANAEPWNVPLGEGDLPSFLAFIPGTSRFAYGSGRTPLKIVDVEDRQVVRTVGAKPISNFKAAFSPDGESVFCVAETGKVEQWSLETGKRVRTFDESAEAGGHDKSLYDRSLGVSPAGDRLAVGDPLAGVLLYDLANGKRIDRGGDGHRRGVVDARFTSDGKTVVSAGADWQCIAWDAATGEVRWRADAPFAPVGLQPLPDGQMLVVGVGHAQKLDPQTGRFAADSLWFGAKRVTEKMERTRRFQDNWMQYILSGDFTGDFTPRYAVRGPGQAVVNGWNLTQGRTVPLDLGANKVGEELACIKEDMDDGPAMAIAPGGDWVLVKKWPYRQMEVVLQATDGNEPLASLGSEYRTTKWRFSPDAQWVACGRPEGIEIIELPTARRVTDLRGVSNAWSLAFGPGGRFLAAGGSNGRVGIWDLATGKQVANAIGHIGAVLAVNFSPDGRQLVSCGADATVALWQVPRAEPLPRLDKDGLATAWKQLLGSPGAAHEATMRLLASGDAASAWIADELPPARKPEAERVAALIEQLGDDDFKLRQAAQAELARMGKAIEESIIEAHASTPRGEKRNRLVALLESIQRGRVVVEGTLLRDRRAVRVLELLATDRARKVLQNQAAGVEGAPLTQDAKAALKRLGLKPSGR